MQFSLPNLIKVCGFSSEQKLFLNYLAFQSKKRRTIFSFASSSSEARENLKFRIKIYNWKVLGILDCILIKKLVHRTLILSTFISRKI